MPQNSLPIDVCVVCALAEEAKAFRRVVEEYCHLSWTKEVNSSHGYDYYLVTVANIKGESVRLHVSWLSRYGSSEMVKHLGRVIEEYRPRLAVMTGICAGDKRQVRLGDLVIAERTFLYDNGKVVKDEQGQSVYLHDTITYLLDPNIKSFVDDFEQWKSDVAKLSRPISKRQQRDWLLERLVAESTGSVKDIPPIELNEHAPAWKRIVYELQQGTKPFLSPSLKLRDKEEIEKLRYRPVPFPYQDSVEASCHIRPLASGNAVRSDDPFEAIRIPVRTAVAVDMEGAAVGMVMGDFPESKWFIVKGVSDYADHEKDDSFHTYAAEASALYALCFIKAYVTQERLHISTSNIASVDEGKLSLEKGKTALWDGSYSFAKKELRKAVEGIDDENQDREASKAKYFLVLALLGGKLPRIQGREVMQFIEELMKDALRIHPYASYYRIFACIKRDFFQYNGFAYRLNEVNTLETKGASLSRSIDDEEIEEYFRHCQPRLQC